MNARNRRRLEALEKQMAARKASLVIWPLLVERFDQGGPNEWVKVDCVPMSPQEAEELIRQNRERVERAGGTHPCAVEVNLGHLSPEELDAALEADNADAD